MTIGKSQFFKYKILIFFYDYCTVLIFTVQSSSIMNSPLTCPMPLLRQLMQRRNSINLYYKTDIHT